MKYCPQCGKQVTDDLIYSCMHCASPLYKDSFIIKIPYEEKYICSFHLTKKSTRTIIGIMGVTLYLLISILYLWNPVTNGYLIIIGIVLSVSISVLNLKKYSLDAKQKTIILPGNFEDLSLKHRLESIDLAWNQVISNLHKPLKNEWTRTQPVFVTLIGTLVISSIMSVSSQDIKEIIYENNLTKDLTLVPPIILASLSIINSIFSFYIISISNKILEDEARQDQGLWVKYSENWFKYTLRSLAVKWVNDKFDNWKIAAINLSKEQTLKHFRLDNNNCDSFILEYLHNQAPKDMPPSETELINLIIGPFLAIRRGVLFDAKETSYKYSISEDKIILTEDSPSEEEFHYSDIVKVNYQRVANQEEKSVERHEGKFNLSLVNGSNFEFPTYEDSVQSAIEAVRIKTRKVKSMST